MRCCRGWAPLLVACCIAGVATAADEDALERGVLWLLSQQAEDGGWHSTTYGQMWCGVGNTALVLDALSRLPARIRTRNQPSIDRGINFLIENLDDHGYVSAPNRGADYPTYGTALLLGAIRRSSPHRWRPEQQQMRDYLLAVQRRGSEQDAHFGGWPQVGGDPEDAAAEMNVNISVSRFAAMALSGYGSPKMPVREAALRFIERCRNPDDGGYSFTPVADDPLNKAGRTSTGEARSYGTATADAVLAMKAWGVPHDDVRLRSAIGWLESRPSLTVVPNVAGESRAVIGAERALRFYYWAALAQVMHEFPDTALATRRLELRKVIAQKQQIDGSWVNQNPLMRENDPLVATALAITAIAALEEEPAE